MKARWLGLGRLAAAGVALALLSAPAARPASHSITVTAGQMRASLKGTPNSAAYMVIANSGGQPDALLSARCACAGEVGIHKTEDMGGMSTMASAAPVAIPAHGEVVFKPGGLHLMLMALKGPLKDGGEQDITLVFRNAGAVTAHFAIRTVIR